MKSTLRKLVESHGSADEKKHLTLLESAAVLDEELEIETPAEGASDVVETAFSDQIHAVMREKISVADKHLKVQEILDAQKVLAEGEPETEEEPAKGPTLESLSEELEQFKQRDGVRTLMESYNVPFEEVKVKSLLAQESREDQVSLLEGWRDGSKPSRSGRKQTDSGSSSYDEHKKQMDAKYGN